MSCLGAYTMKIALKDSPVQRSRSAHYFYRLINKENADSKYTDSEVQAS